jgi:hypothetical protein
MKNNRQITRTVKIQPSYNNNGFHSMGMGTQIGFPSCNKKVSSKNIKN